MVEAYFDMVSLYLVEKILEISSMSVEFRILKSLKFSGGELWSHGTGFLILTLALSFFFS